MRIEVRQLPPSNVWADDIIVYGTPVDYQSFAEFVDKCLETNSPTLMLTESDVLVEIVLDESQDELLSSYQVNQSDDASMEHVNHEIVLRVCGNRTILSVLKEFLVDLSGRGDGYSYLCEYSEKYDCAEESKDWRMHVEDS